MRAAFPVRTLASLFAAAALGTLTPACSLGVEASAPEEEEITLLPPLLELETPRADLVYGLADDLFPDEPGVQLRLRVRVNDVPNSIWLEDLALGVDGPEKLVQVPVREDWRGDRHAEIAFTVFPDDEIRPITLVARAGNGLDELEHRIFIGSKR